MSFPEQKQTKIYPSQAKFPGICQLLISNPAQTHLNTKAYKNGVQHDVKKASRYGRDPHTEVSSRCCWQSVETKKKTNERGLCKLLCQLVQQEAPLCWFIGPSFPCAIRPLFQPEIITTSILPASPGHIYMHTRTTRQTTNPGGSAPSPSSSVHFLPAGQHCLFKEGEDE